jgi:hypothetical protein
MLRDGKFIKEEPPKIGSRYVPPPNLINLTCEEKFMQNILLENKPDKFSIMSKVLGMVLRV